MKKIFNRIKANKLCFHVVGIICILSFASGNAYSDNHPTQQLTPLNGPQVMGVLDCPDGTKICKTGEEISFGQCTYILRGQVCGRCDGHSSPQTLCDQKVSITKKWMHKYSHRSLLELTLPAVHDGLMGNINFPDLNNDCTLGGNRFNARTQDLSPQELLSSGFRLFDIRPIVDYSQGQKSPRFYSHHGEFKANKMLGCLGYRLDKMLDTTAQFLIKNPSELVIIELTHMREVVWDAAASGGDASKRSQTLIADLVSKKLASFLIKDKKLKDILNTPLSTLTSAGKKGKVLIIHDGISSIFTPKKGFYNKDSDLFYDRYTKTNEYKVLYHGGKNNDGTKRKDQATEAWYASKESEGKKFVYLDWTLTQSTAQAVSCGAVSGTGIIGYAACKIAGGSIEDLSEDANWYLTKSDGLINFYKKWKYTPNAVSVDYGSAKIARKIIEWNGIE